MERARRGEVAMNHLEKIEKSRELQMTLSKMLFEALEMGCWHLMVNEHSEMMEGYEFSVDACIKCELKGMTDQVSNPNLFIRESFLGVWDTVKDREGFKEEFMLQGYLMRNSTIASPHFQLEVLKWLLGEDKVREVLDEED